MKQIILILMDGYRDDAMSVFRQMGYLFLDEALGEYGVEVKQGIIDFESRASKYFEKARPLSALPSSFDDHFAKKRQ